MNDHIKFGDPKNWNDTSLYLRSRDLKKYNNEFAELIKKEIDSRGGIESISLKYEENRKLETKKRTKKTIKRILLSAVILVFLVLGWFTTNSILKNHFRETLLLSSSYELGEYCSFARKSSAESLISSDLASLQLIKSVLYSQLIRKYNVEIVNSEDIVRMKDSIPSHYIWINAHLTTMIIEMQEVAISEYIELECWGANSNFSGGTEVSKISGSEPQDYLSKLRKESRRFKINKKTSFDINAEKVRLIFTTIAPNKSNEQLTEEIIELYEAKSGPIRFK